MRLPTGYTHGVAGAPKTYDFRAQALGGAVVNAAINGGIGYALLAGGKSLPLWGLPSVAFDLAAMAFGIAFGTGLIVTAQLRALENKGHLRPPVLSEAVREGFAKWPDAIMHRAINLGVLGVICFAPLPLLGLWLFAPDGLDQAGLTWFKGTFGAVEGAVVTPIIGAAAFRRRAVVP